MGTPFSEASGVLLNQFIDRTLYRFLFILTSNQIAILSECDDIKALSRFFIGYVYKNLMGERECFRVIGCNFRPTYSFLKKKSSGYGHLEFCRKTFCPRLHILISRKSI